MLGPEFEILAERRGEHTGQLSYFVKSKGAANHTATWMPATQIINQQVIAAWQVVQKERQDADLASLAAGGREMPVANKRGSKTKSSNTRQKNKQPPPQKGKGGDDGEGGGLLCWGNASGCFHVKIVQQNTVCWQLHYVGYHKRHDEWVRRWGTKAHDVARHFMNTVM